MCRASDSIMANPHSATPLCSGLSAVVESCFMLFFSAKLSEFVFIRFSSIVRSVNHTFERKVIYFRSAGRFPKISATLDL